MFPNTEPLPHLDCCVRAQRNGAAMGRLSMATRKELTAVAAERYLTANHAEKSRILDEFVHITGYHRKHAMRLLRGDVEAQIGGRKPRRTYDEAERNALALLWEHRTEFAASG